MPLRLSSHVNRRCYNRRECLRLIGERDGRSAQPPRFLDARAEVYEDVIAELRVGRKTSHWMWFIFPQLKGLGRSSTAQYFAIASLDEARAYLAHLPLGTRLRQCTELVNHIQNSSVEQIFGSPDDLKFRSSMTLFRQAAPLGSADHQLFAAALAKYFAGQPDPLTLALIKV